MKARIELAKDWKFFQPLLAVNAAIDAGGLDHKLLHLVEMRASQINGCAYCIDMHSKDARALGEDRAAPLQPRRVARSALLQRPRARGPGVD